MNTNKIKTPETDKMQRRAENEYYDVELAMMVSHARDLERRLVVARNALEFYANVSLYPSPLTGGLGELYFDCGSIAKNALTQTAPKP